MHKRCIKCIADYYFPGYLKSISVVYGSRYVIETPDALLGRYQEMRLNAPDTLKNYLIESFYHSEFKDDAEKLEQMIKINSIEPMPHVMMTETSGLSLPKEIYTGKVYFSEWVNTLTDADRLMDREKLKENFDSYINEKLKNDEQFEQRAEEVQ
jgi:hypothetical protein